MTSGIFSFAHPPAGGSLTYTPPLDSLVTNNTVAIGFRKLKTSYAGQCIRIRASGDDVETDIGFSSNGSVNDSAIQTHLGTHGGSAYIVKMYDQSGNSNDAVQNTKANQWLYVANGAPNSTAVARGSATSGMVIADNASFKTSVVHVFIVNKWGLETNNTPENWYIVGYPTTTSSTIGASRWALTSPGVPDAIQFEANGANENWPGLGAVYRNQLYQYELCTSDRTSKFNSVAWADGTDIATITYPNAVGIYIGMNAAGGQNLYKGDFSELIISSSKQSNRDTISANQTSYYGIVAPSTSASTSDGFTWTPYYSSNFPGDGSPNKNVWPVINSKAYFTEGAFNSYSLWQANNVNNSQPMWRFEVRQWDRDGSDVGGGGNERCELDGSSDGAGGTFSYAIGKTVQTYLKIYVETGSALNPQDWNIFHQDHYTNATTGAAVTYSLGITNADHFRVDVAQNQTGAQTLDMGAFTRGQWYDIFVERFQSNNNTDTLKIWVNGSLTINLTSGNLFRTTDGNKDPTYPKFGIYRGFPGTCPVTEAIRIAGFQHSDKSVSDISSLIASPPAAPTHA